MTPADTPEIARLRELLGKATPGHMFLRDTSGSLFPGVILVAEEGAGSLGGDWVFQVLRHQPHLDDAALGELIAAAVNALPGLLSRLTQAEAERDDWKQHAIAHTEALTRTQAQLSDLRKRAVEAVKPLERMGYLIYRYQKFCVENGYPKPDFNPLADGFRRAAAFIEAEKENG